MTARVVICRAGGGRWPWHARCTGCAKECTHIVAGLGAISVNDRGIGNRTWPLALAAAYAHLACSHQNRGADQ